MKVKNTYIKQSKTERLIRQAELHRYCILLLASTPKEVRL